MKKYFLIFLLLSLLGCSSIEDKQEPSWELGREVKIQGCEEWKQRDPEADC